MDVSRRKIWILMLAVGMLALSLAAAPDGQPKLVFPATQHHFGKVDRGTKLEHTFVVRNEGTAPLEILSVKPT